MSGALEKGLVTVLTATATCYPRVVQPAAFPLVRYQLIYITRDVSIDGSKVGVTEAGLQLDCMATTYDGAKTLADAVRGVLHAYSGSWGTLVARFVELENETDAYEQEGDKVIHWVSQRYKVWTDME